METSTLSPTQASMLTLSTIEPTTSPSFRSTMAPLNYSYTSTKANTDSPEFTPVVDNAMSSNDQGFLTSILSETTWTIVFVSIFSCIIGLCVGCCICMIKRKQRSSTMDRKKPAISTVTTTSHQQTGKFGAQLEPQPHVQMINVVSCSDTDNQITTTTSNQLTQVNWSDTRFNLSPPTQLNEMVDHIGREQGERGKSIDSTMSEDSEGMYDMVDSNQNYLTTPRGTMDNTTSESNHSSI